MRKFKHRIGNLELRSGNNLLLYGGKHTTCEIVKWIDSEHCITIAYWLVDDYDDTSLHFVDDRPFAKDVDRAVLIDFMEIGQNKLKKNKTP